MSQILSSAEEQQKRLIPFTVGIPISAGDSDATEALVFVLRERLSLGHQLKRIVAVASGLSAEQLSALKSLAAQDRRILIIEEDKRYGKWEALNRILDSAEGEYLVLLNGDALPLPGSIDSLLEKISSDSDVAVASAFPLVYSNTMVTGRIIKIFWDAHNEALTRLARTGSNNHSCDELMAIRLASVSKLPSGTINDGAYMAGRAYLEGYQVTFCQDAFVKVRVPRKLGDLLRQRRRIVYGHMQIWKLLGKPPRTMESIAVMNPIEAISILTTVMARDPTLIPILPIAVIEEAFSVTLAFLDNLLGGNRHIVWDRYVS
ncbi:MAG: glycosyltransferase [Nitrososphaerota archaeon]|nr:glycosyltransferase [Nitrososphaerota archaeon]